MGPKIESEIIGVLDMKKIIVLVIICSLLFVTCILFGANWIYNSFINPFKTPEQRHARDYWEHAIKEYDHEVRLRSVGLIEKEVIFFCRLENYESATRFNEEEFIKIKDIVEQITDTLNSKDDIFFQNKTIEISFLTGKGMEPRDIRFYLAKDNEDYVLDKISSKVVSDVSQLAIFDKVRIIEYVGSVESNKELERLGMLTNLEEIKLFNNQSEDKICAFVKTMQSILPNCKVTREKY